MSAEDGPVFDADMIGDADLPADDYVVFNDRAAGKAGLRGDDDVLADLDVVTNMDQVVDLCPSANASFVKSAAVNGRVCANVDVVFDYQPADLRELLVAAGLLVANVAEAFAAEHGTGLDSNSIAQGRARIHRDIRVQTTMRADFDGIAKYAAGADSGVVPNLRMVADNGPRGDVHVFADMCRTCDNR